MTYKRTKPVQWENPHYQKSPSTREAGRRKAIRDKFEEFKFNWHTEKPFKVKSGDSLGSVNINFDFVSYLMTGIRSSLPWGKYKIGEGTPDRFVDRLSLSETLCQQYVLILHEMVSFLGMPTAVVHFSSKGNPKCNLSHWGLDVELVNDRWAFFDPTFCLCAREEFPLCSHELKDRPEILESWYNNFNHFKASFSQEGTPPEHFKRHIEYWEHYDYFFDTSASVPESKAFLTRARDRTDNYLTKIGQSCVGYLNESRFIKI